MESKEQKVMPFIRRLLDGAEVEWKPLGEICAIKTGKGITKKDAISDGTYPIISGGKMPMDYIDIYNREANTVTVSRVGANAGFVSYISERFYLNDKCFSIIPKKDNVLIPRFLYYGLKSQEDNISTLQSQGGVPTINTAKLGNVRLPLPPLPVQKEIVRILDKFTTLEAELKAELDCRKRQYEYYRNQLLSFEMLNGGGKTLNNITIKTLGEVIKPTTNIKWSKTKSMYQYIDLTSVDIETKKISSTKEITSETAPSRAQKIVQTNDVIFATTRPTQMRIAIIPNEYNEQVASTGYCILRADNEQVLPKWIYFQLSTDIFRNFLENNQSGTAYPAISDSSIKDFKIPIPSLSEQQRIVSILDKFDTLINSISEGLPKEIELRRKQYEYYRNALLSFNHISEHKSASVV